jgi:hypothetical protein
MYERILIPSTIRQWNVPYRGATKSRVIPSQNWISRFQRSNHYPYFIKASIAFWTNNQSAPIGMPGTGGKKLNYKTLVRCYGHQRGSQPSNTETWNLNLITDTCKPSVMAVIQCPDAKKLHSQWGPKCSLALSITICKGIHKHGEYYFLGGDTTCCGSSAS